MPLLALISLTFLVGCLVARSVAKTTPRTALRVALGGGLVLAALAVMVRTSDGLQDADEAVAEWGDAHDGTGWATDVIRWITDAGQPRIAIAITVVIGVAATIARRDRFIPLFLLAVVGGTALLTTAIKELADRSRPALNPLAETLGPSFPSGHSSYTAAALAGLAIVLSRGRGRRTLAVLAGVAAGWAVAVAASRVLLDEHWLSDVVGGLALGWGWFALCALLFIRRAPAALRRPAPRLARGRPPSRAPG